MGEAHAALVEDVEDRVPPVGEVAGSPRRHRPRPTGGNIATYFQIAEPVKPDDGVDAEPLRRPRRHLHLLGRALPHALGVAVAPDPVGQDRPVPLVDRVVADGLALEVVGDRPDLEAVLLQQVELALDVRVVLRGPPHVEVVAPAGDLEAVVPPLGRRARHISLERQVGPLAGEQGDGSGHGVPFSVSSPAAAVEWASRPASRSRTSTAARRARAGGPGSEQSRTGPSAGSSGSRPWVPETGCRVQRHDAHRVAQADLLAGQGGGRPAP